MIIEFSINPNCSESVYRFGKVDIKKLPGGMKFINRMMKKYWGDLRPIEEIVGTDSIIEYAVQGEYSTLRPENDSDICVYFYQTSCEELEQELLERKIPYKAEKPFTDGINTPKKYLYNEERH
jgi:hypothetical protein